MFKFKLSYVALAAALTSTFVYADPMSYTLPSGTKIIDIEAPNAAGVSHNKYQEFNVNSKGTILNNNANVYAATSQGNIARNNNLANGSASVILNEVISNKASSLQGFLEVGGQRADVIIANPNGITCSGCSFINTNKAVLTTGAVSLTDTGAIGSYKVTGGNITVDQYGMNAANSYALILADAININGNVTAANAILSAGNSTFDNSTGQSTSAGKSATTTLQMLIPEYSIDISQLGGIQANNITMLGNNLGFGVRNKGAIVANTALAMTSNGTLVNEGSITNNGYLTQMVSAGKFKNSGTISNNYIAAITSLSGLTNDGTISSNNQLVVSAAGDIVNNGTIKATNAAAITTKGALKTTYGSNLRAGSQLTLSSLGNMTIGGSTYSKNTSAVFGGTNFSVTGNITGEDNLLIQSVKDNSLSSGEIANSGKISGGNVIVQTTGSLLQAAGSRLNASKSLTAQSYYLKNSGYMGGLDANVNISNSVTENEGTIEGSALSLTTWQDLYNGGVFRASGDMSLSTQNNGNIYNRGTLVAADQLTLTAKQVFNGGVGCGFFGLARCGVGSMKANNLTLNSTHSSVSSVGGTQNFKYTQINTVK